MGDPQRRAEWGSDLIVEMIRALDVPYVALNPGATFRGLHDSLVNFNTPGHPELILCCHEEIAVALAHGYAKVTGRPMAAAVHNIVGLQHATMAIYNAWCDRTPVLVLGGTGPMDTTQRRPWIDWVHTALVQGQQVRDYVKWDDQPASVAAIPESLLRAHRIALTSPQGPVYVCYDVALQEERIEEPPDLPSVGRYAPPAGPAPDPLALENLARLLLAAERPVVLADQLGRASGASNSLVDLVELLGLPVLEQPGQVNMPTQHPLNLTGAAAELLSQTDLVLALNVQDLYGGLVAGPRERGMPIVVPRGAKIAHICLNDYVKSGWAGDHQRLVPVDLPIAADTAAALPALASVCRRLLADDSAAVERILERTRRLTESGRALRQGWNREAAADVPGGAITFVRLTAAVRDAVRGTEWALVNDHYASPWTRRLWDIRDPQHYVAPCRGGGLGYGIGASLGAALAHRASGRLCVNLQTDGDLMYAPTALWTAAHHTIPMLVVVCNNRSYGNDEHHQARVAMDRGRPVENKGVGIHLTDPPVDFSAMARSFGVEAVGPVTREDHLGVALDDAVRFVREQRKPYLVDVVLGG